MDASLKIAQLEVEMRQLHAEVARLQHRLSEAGHHGRRVRRARQDAEMIAGAWLAHRPLTREYVLQQRVMGQRRWEAARALLKLARVISHDGRRLIVTNQEAISRRLDQAVTAALAEPAAFRARLPRRMDRRA